MGTWWHPDCAVSSASATVPRTGWEHERMPLNASLEGKEYGEVTLPVVREQVMEFADAIGERNPIFRDPEAARAAGYPEQVAPPTFVAKMQIMSSGQVFVDPEIGLADTGVVRGG